MARYYAVTACLPSSLEGDLSLLRGSLPHVEWVPKSPLLLPLSFFSSEPENPDLEECHYDLTQLKWESFSLSLENIFLKDKQHLSQNFLEIHLDLSQKKEITHLRQKIATLLHKNKISISSKKVAPSYLLGRIEMTHQKLAFQWVQHYHLFKSQEVTLSEIALIECPPLTKKQLLPPLSLSPEILEIYHACDRCPSPFSHHLPPYDEV